MDVSDLEIKISKELIPYICTIKDGKTVADKANLSLILGLFASQVITLEKASELAEKNESDLQYQSDYWIDVNQPPFPSLAII